MQTISNKRQTALGSCNGKGQWVNKLAYSPKTLSGVWPCAICSILAGATPEQPGLLGALLLLPLPGTGQPALPAPTPAPTSVSLLPALC